jgi:hypothetical protein
MMSPKTDALKNRHCFHIGSPRKDLKRMVKVRIFLIPQ